MPSLRKFRLDGATAEEEVYPETNMVPQAGAGVSMASWGRANFFLPKYVDLISLWGIKRLLKNASWI